MAPDHGREPRRRILHRTGSGEDLQGAGPWQCYLHGVCQCDAGECASEAGGGMTSPPYLSYMFRRRCSNSTTVQCFQSWRRPASKVSLSRMGGLLPRQLHLAWIHRNGDSRPPPEGVEGEVE